MVLAYEAVPSQAPTAHCGKKKQSAGRNVSFHANRNESAFFAANPGVCVQRFVQLATDCNRTQNGESSKLPFFPPPPRPRTLCGDDPPLLEVFLTCYLCRDRGQAIHGTGSMSRRDFYYQHGHRN